MHKTKKKKEKTQKVNFCSFWAAILGPKFGILQNDPRAYVLAEVGAVIR